MHNVSLIDKVHNESKVDLLQDQHGRFILATSQLDQKVLTDKDMLLGYKERHKKEKIFSFIKNNTLEVSSVFLKRESRVQALMMVMTFCLLVYSFSELLLRNCLIKNNDTISNTLKKTTQKPTMMRVFRIFHGIQELNLQFKGYRKRNVINSKNVHQQIIEYFGSKAMHIYGLKNEQ